MDTGTDALQNSAAFDTLPLHPDLHANLKHLGYQTMTPIQAASLPLALSGKDLIAQAKTGSGRPPPSPCHCSPTSTRAASPCRPSCSARHANWPTR